MLHLWGYDWENGRASDPVLQEILVELHQEKYLIEFEKRNKVWNFISRL
jgi:hypothetical protein